MDSKRVFVPLRKSGLMNGLLTTMISEFPKNKTLFLESRGGIVGVALELASYRDARIAKINYVLIYPRKLQK